MDGILDVRNKEDQLICHVMYSEGTRWSVMSPQGGLIGIKLDSLRVLDDAIDGKTFQEVVAATNNGSLTI